MTGIVTNSRLTGEVPAGFAAHSKNSSDYGKIAEDYLYHTRPDIMIGGGGYGISREAAEKAGYASAENMDELLKLVYSSAYTGSKICALFDPGIFSSAAEKTSGHPSLYSSRRSSS